MKLLRNVFVGVLVFLFCFYAGTVLSCVLFELDDVPQIFRIFER